MAVFTLVGEMELSPAGVEKGVKDSFKGGGGGGWTEFPANS